MSGSPAPHPRLRLELPVQLQDPENCNYEASVPVGSVLWAPPSSLDHLTPFAHSSPEAALPCPLCPWYLFCRDSYHLHGQLVGFPWSAPPAGTEPRPPAEGQMDGRQQSAPRKPACVDASQVPEGRCGLGLQVYTLPASALSARLHRPAGHPCSP